MSGMHVIYQFKAVHAFIHAFSCKQLQTGNRFQLNENRYRLFINFITVAKLSIASKGNRFLSLEIRYLKKRVWVFQNWFIKPVLPKTKPISIWPLENVLKNVLWISNQNRYRVTGNRYHMTVGKFPETEKRDFWKSKPNDYAVLDPKRFNPCF